jgi:hypothetical protein
MSALLAQLIPGALVITFLQKLALCQSKTQEALHTLHF